MLCIPVIRHGARVQMLPSERTADQARRNRHRQRFRCRDPLQTSALLTRTSQTSRSRRVVASHRFQRLNEAAIEPNDDGIGCALNRQTKLIKAIVVYDHVAFAWRWPFLEDKPKILWRIVGVAIQEAPHYGLLQALTQRTSIPNEPSARTREIFFNEAA